MKYTKDQFIWDVINEAVALRKHATKEERLRLSFYLLNPFSAWNCVYGQIAGDCFSKRAAELIFKCCTRFFYAAGCSMGNNIYNIIDQANGINSKNFIKIRTNDIEGTKMYSALEAYITLRESNKENLIAYLRGEIKELDLYF